jgi:hypothetical protein
MRSNLFPGIESGLRWKAAAGREVENRVRRCPLGTRVAARAYHNRRLLPWTAISYCEDFTNQPRRRAHGRAVRPMSCRGPTLKSREAIWVSRKRLGKDLDRDFALQPRVARAIHSHAACADGGNDLVRPESSAWISGLVAYLRVLNTCLYLGGLRRSCGRRKSFSYLFSITGGGRNPTSQPKVRLSEEESCETRPRWRAKKATHRRRTLTPQAAIAADNVGCVPPQPIKTGLKRCFPARFLSYGASSETRRN